MNSLLDMRPSTKNDNVIKNINTFGKTQKKQLIHGCPGSCFTNANVYAKHKVLLYLNNCNKDDHVHKCKTTSNTI